MVLWGASLVAGPKYRSEGWQHIVPDFKPSIADQKRVFPRKKQNLEEEGKSLRTYGCRGCCWQEIGTTEDIWTMILQQR